MRERDEASLRQASLGTRVHLIPGDVASISLSSQLSSTNSPQPCYDNAAVIVSDNEDDDAGFLHAYRLRAAAELHERVTSARDAARGASLVTHLTHAAALPLWANGLLPHITGFVLFWGDGGHADGVNMTTTSASAWIGALRGAAALAADAQLPWALAEMRASDASSHFDVIGLPAGAVYRRGDTVCAFVRLQDDLCRIRDSADADDGGDQDGRERLGAAPLSRSLFQWLSSSLISVT